MKPIKPSQVKEKTPLIPDSIIECVNNMIENKWDGFESKFYQKDLLKEVLEKDKALSKEEIFQKKFLDFEYLFRKSGWIVAYDKPAYNETYEAFWIFRKK